MKSNNTVLTITYI